VVDDTTAMSAAIAAARAVRTTTSPNPWVGAVVVAASGQIVGTGATQPPGGAHAEREALRQAGPMAGGATLVTTLEPCNHTGRTPPCTDAVIAAGIARVVVGIEDPDPLVAGQGVSALRAAGIDVTVGVEADAVAAQLAPYLVHRRTGRPYVVLKLAATVDGRTAAPDGTSQWITGDDARADAHRLRAESDAVLVGAGTVRTDDPSLTVRHVEGRDPLRVVLGRAPAGARIHPCLELSGDLLAVLDDLGGRGVLQVLVEGGATVAHAFHAAGLVDRYVVYLAPAVFGGDDALGLFRGPAAPTIAALARGRFTSVSPLGADVRLDLVMDRSRA
jgi:diaminohydroxyphosphoribosylaminopyrimidine deaminase/5-amino-6-(5-phosphoribosylamino)uracil reductase